ncbi:MAG TPA: translation initiation factor IF-2 associated domain-containing protein, partial [Denitromonas sp.]|nr:translation initiation factor IF-2 associated domain-containing protein [Denitromonas sp.]
MEQITVTQFAGELKMPAALLLEQLNKAGVSIADANGQLTEQDKNKLLDYLRRSHGEDKTKSKITLTRKETSEIKATDSTGRARTVQVEVRKKRVFVKRDELVAEAEARKENDADAEGGADADVSAEPVMVEIETPQVVEPVAAEPEVEVVEPVVEAPAPVVAVEEAPAAVEVEKPAEPADSAAAEVPSEAPAAAKSKASKAEPAEAAAEAAPVTTTKRRVRRVQISELLDPAEIQARENESRRHSDLLARQVADRQAREEREAAARAS